MKTNNFLFLLLICAINISCQNNTFNLASIKLGESAEKYNFDKNNLLEKVPNSPEELILYSSRERQGLAYDKIPIDNANITFITVWKNKIVSIQTFARKENSLLFAEKLLSELGAPTKVLTDKQTLDENIRHQIFEQFYKVSPNFTKQADDEANTIEYPYMFLGQE